LGASTDVSDFETLWRLHPRVRHNDPKCAECGSSDDHRGGEEPHAVAKTGAAKEHEAQEASFKHESKDSFGGEKTPEDVSDES
jgi:hypothetical protein